MLCSAFIVYSGGGVASESGQIQGLPEDISELFTILLKELPARWNVSIVEEIVKGQPDFAVS